MRFTLTGIKKIVKYPFTFLHESVAIVKTIGRDCLERQTPCLFC